MMSRWTQERLAGYTMNLFEIRVRSGKPVTVKALDAAHAARLYAGEHKHATISALIVAPDGCKWDVTVSEGCLVYFKEIYAVNAAGQVIR